MSINSKVPILLAAALLTGCAASAAPMHRTPAIPAADRRALEGAVSQYDRQIAALRATLSAPAFRSSTRDADAAIASLRSAVGADSALVHSLVAQRADAYAAREDDAVSAVLATASASAPSRSDVQRRLQNDYRAEYAQLRAGAQGDMNAYQQALLAQQQRAYATFVRAIQDRTTQAYQHRAAELNEKESALLLELARRDAPQRLQLRAELATLALDSSNRASIRVRLNAMQAHEDRVVAQAQTTDARVLSAYRDRLLAQANGDVAAMSAQLAARTQANLAQRRDVLAAQRGAPANLPLSSAPREPSGETADMRARVTAMRAAGARTFRDDAAATAAAYAAARDDVASRFAYDRDTDRAATRSTLDAIAQLQRDRDALAAQLSQ